MNFRDQVRQGGVTLSKAKRRMTWLVLIAKIHYHLRHVKPLALDMGIKVAFLL